MSLPLLKNISAIVHINSSKPSFTSSSFCKMTATALSSAKREMSPSIESENPGQKFIENDLFVFFNQKGPKVFNF